MKEKMRYNRYKGGSKMLIKRLSFMSILFSLLFSFSIYAMPKNLNANEPVSPTPKDISNQNEERWTWLNDNLCVQFRTGGPDNSTTTRAQLQKKYDLGTLDHWYADGKIKVRESYSGKWLQDDEGIWSFVFDDNTIPVEITKIDDVLYAFNSYGELREGVVYYGKAKTPYDNTGTLTTGADGVVNSDNPDFLAWLETQYVPACTSHE